MQTFFVTYNTGEYDSYHEHVYAIDAESKEVLLAEIDRACDEYLVKFNKYQTERNRVNEKYRPKNHKTAGQKDWKLYHRELNKLYENIPYPSDMIVFGNKISPFDELTVSGKDEAIVVSRLDVMTIDEYVESCRPQSPQKESDDV